MRNNTVTKVNQGDRTPWQEFIAPPQTCLWLPMKNGFAFNCRHEGVFPRLVGYPDWADVRFCPFCGKEVQVHHFAPRWTKAWLAKHAIAMMRAL